MRGRNSFRERLDDSKDLPRIEEIPPQLATRWGASGTMVIPAPREVDEVMRRVPRGRLITVNQIRAALARKHEVATACPITTGAGMPRLHGSARESEAGRCGAQRRGAGSRNVRRSRSTVIHISVAAAVSDTISSASARKHSRRKR